MTTEPVYRVIASSLNVRKAPSITAPVLGWLRKDDLVDGVDTSGDGYWHKVRKGELLGWCAQKFLSLVAEASDSPFAWMAVARAEIGVKEFTGSGDNPRIVQYLRSTTLDAPSASHDETAWCSAFVNWCVERAGYEGTDSAWAKSWLRWGRDAGGEPPPGSVVVLERPPDPSSGHVGFLVEGPDLARPREQRLVTLLGGNQNDAVRVSAYPASRIAGFRVPGP